MKKTLLFIAILIAGMLIGGSFDAEVQQLQSQPNHTTK